MFIHDFEHSYKNIKFELPLTLKYMKAVSMLLSDDVRSDSLFQELLDFRGFDSYSACILENDNSCLGGLCLSKPEPDYVE